VAAGAHGGEGLGVGRGWEGLRGMAGRGRARVWMLFEFEWHLNCCVDCRWCRSSTLEWRRATNRVPLFKDSFERNSELRSTWLTPLPHPHLGCVLEQVLHVGKLPGSQRQPGARVREAGGEGGGGEVGGGPQVGLQLEPGITAWGWPASIIVSKEIERKRKQEEGKRRENRGGCR
jgi:hypothetical protein